MPIETTAGEETDAGVTAQAGPDVADTADPLADAAAEPRAQSEEPVPGEQGGESTAEKRPPHEDKAKKEAGVANQVTDAVWTFYRGPVAFTYNTFNGAVTAPGSTFGVREGAGPRSGGHRKVTGRIGDEHAAATVRRYAAPPCFVEAQAKLRTHHVVVVEGRPGTGRRSGAINLLREVTREPLVVLSPTLSLRELAERAYDSGFGYLILDHVYEQRRVDLEFTWANVQENIERAGAFLVITNSCVGGTASSAVPHIAWDLPSAEAVLRAQLGPREDLDTIVHDVLAAFGDDAAPAKLAAVARLIRDDNLSVEEALKKLDESARRQVLEWFAGRPAHRDVVAAAALCFLEGTDIRTYEVLLDDLHEVLAGRVSGKRAKAQLRKRDADMFGERETRLHGTGLLQMRSETWNGAPIEIVAFKDDAYRRYVLAELWRTQTNHFWDSVCEWLTEAAVSRFAESHTAVASGLAWLACSSVNETQRCYLEPWSAATTGWPGQVTAAYALWFMCHRDELASIALQTAVRWARSGDSDQRWTAAFALGGELGMFFPSDAVNRLWQLMTRDTDLWVIGCASMAALFATLSDDEDGDPVTVLNLLGKKMTDFGTGAGPADRKGPVPAVQLMRLRTLTMTAALSVVSASSIRTGRPAVAEYLARNRRRAATGAEPLAGNRRRMAMIARIWAGVLTFRPLRWEAFFALRLALHALRDIDEDYLATSRDFGTALAEALPEAERRTFKDAFMQVDERARKGRKEPLAEVLVACIEAITRKIHSGGVR
ncbi:hypothetical protein AB0J72_20255 [Dactylosporangium sp. NPDC049742]|uniref:hypothetical protein n=1 Tax=Dactylosporangium sp. NPDC049742 TaxID=3154737 RepID=UPI003420EA69